MKECIEFRGLIRSRSRYYVEQNSLLVIAQLIKVVGMACLVGLLAQVRIALPFSPVPITAQTIGVLLAGVMLGPGWGGLSLAFYLAMGWGLLPWFSGLAMGITPTGGYLIGFIGASILVGLASRHAGRSRAKLVGIMLTGSLLIYLPGVIWLYFWLGGDASSIGSLITIGILPFLPGDMMKSFIAAGVAWAIAGRK